MKTATVKDYYTNDEFIPRRSNQKFMTPTNRIAFYNQKAKVLRLKKSSIDKPLHRNYLILEEIMDGKDVEIFHREFLLGKGFNSNISTGVEVIDGIRLWGMYDYVMEFLTEGIKISRHG